MAQDYLTDSTEWTLPAMTNAVLASVERIPYIDPRTNKRGELIVFTGEADTMVAVYLSAPTRETLSPESLADCLPRTFKLPCGETVRFEIWEAIPLYDVPCPCGDPSHWFVKVRIDPSLDRRTKE